MFKTESPRRHKDTKGHKVIYLRLPLRLRAFVAVLFSVPTSSALEHELAVLRINTDNIFRRELAFEYCPRQRVFEFLLNGSLQRSRTINRIESHFGNIVQCRIGNLELHFHLVQPLYQILQLYLCNASDMPLVQ